MHAVAVWGGAGIGCGVVVGGGGFGEPIPGSGVRVAARRGISMNELAVGKGVGTDV